jgi:hypothetical protein
MLPLYSGENTSKSPLFDGRKSSLAAYVIVHKPLFLRITAKKCSTAKNI